MKGTKIKRNSLNCLVSMIMSIRKHVSRNNAHYPLAVLVLNVLNIFLKRKREIRKTYLMFLKYYAPNRCLNIKVAKLRNGVGSAEASYLRNCSVKLFREHFKVQFCKGR